MKPHFDFRGPFLCEPSRTCKWVPDMNQEKYMKRQWKRIWPNLSYTLPTIQPTGTMAKSKETFKVVIITNLEQKQKSA